MLDLLRSLTDQRDRAEIQRLLAQIEQLQSEGDELHTEVKELIQDQDQMRAENDELGQRVSELERASKCQATPFRRKQTKAHPKRPGRRSGQDVFTHRPQPEEIHQTQEGALPEMLDLVSL